MRTYSIFIVLLLQSIGLWAQSSAVNAAFGAYTRKDYVMMLEKSEMAIQHEKTKNWSKAWYYRGLAYDGLANSNPEKYPNARIEAAHSFIKANELTQKKPDQVDLNSKYRILENQLLNDGVALYNATEYQRAYNTFEAAVSLSEGFGKIDSLSVYNAALAAERNGNTENAIRYYLKSHEIGYKAANALSAAAILYSRNEEDEKAESLLKKGVELYPNDAIILTSLVNQYLKKGLHGEAIALLDKLIAETANNAIYYFSRATLKENIGKDLEAIPDYEQAIQIDPNYFDAYYNFGANYFNRGVDLNNEASNSTDDQVYKTKKQEATELFKKALPLLEKAFELQPNDQNTKRSLLQLYMRLGLDDKYSELKDK